MLFIPLLLISRRAGLSSLLGAGRMFNCRAQLLQSLAGLYVPPLPCCCFPPAAPPGGPRPPGPGRGGQGTTPRHGRASSPDATSRGRPAPAPGDRPLRAWARRANALPASLLLSKWRRGGGGRGSEAARATAEGNFLPEAARQGRAAGGGRGGGPPLPAPQLPPPPGPAPVTMTAGGRLPLPRAASPPPAPPPRPRC